MAWIRKRSATSEIHLYGKGWTAGYTEYRYGEKRPRKKPAVAFRYRSKQHRQQVREFALATLRCWSHSLFEQEGSCRAELRSAFCLDGTGWTVADEEAARVVAETLASMGATRPNWEQGQREYTTAHDDCSYCGMQMPSAMRHGNRRGRFCSTVCAERALIFRDANFKKSAVGAAAHRLLLREERPSLTCEHCKKAYQPFSGLKEQYEKQRYCSTDCHYQAARVRDDRRCKACSKQFHPQRDSEHYCSLRCARTHVRQAQCEQCGGDYETTSHKAKFCSTACSLKSSRARRAASGLDGPGYLLTCAVCEKHFRARMPEARYCSNSCSTRFARLKRKVKVLTPQIFDGWFQEAA